MPILPIILFAVSLLFLVAELWSGIAVTGWQGEHPYIERASRPGPYWMAMSLHILVGLGLPILFFLLGF